MKLYDPCEEAFLQMKRSLTNVPVLAYADSAWSYNLHANALNEGLTGIIVSGTYWTSKAIERNYPLPQAGADFNFKTDPLTYICITAK